MSLKKCGKAVIFLCIFYAFAIKKVSFFEGKIKKTHAELMIISVQFSCFKTALLSLFERAKCFAVDRPLSIHPSPMAKKGFLNFAGKSGVCPINNALTCLLAFCFQYNIIPLYQWHTDLPKTCIYILKPPVRLLFQLAGNCLKCNELNSFLRNQRGFI